MHIIRYNRKKTWMPPDLLRPPRSRSGRPGTPSPSRTDSGSRTAAEPAADGFSNNKRSNMTATHPLKSAILISRAARSAPGPWRPAVTVDVTFQENAEISVITPLKNERAYKRAYGVQIISNNEHGTELYRNARYASLTEEKILDGMYRFWNHQCNDLLHCGIRKHRDGAWKSIHAEGCSL